MVPSQLLFPITPLGVDVRASLSVILCLSKQISIVIALLVMIYMLLYMLPGQRFFFVLFHYVMM